MFCEWNLNMSKNVESFKMLQNKRPAPRRIEDVGDIKQYSPAVKVAKTVKHKQVMNDVHDDIDESEDLHRKDGDKKKSYSAGGESKEQQGKGTLTKMHILSPESGASGSTESKTKAGDPASSSSEALSANRRSESSELESCPICLVDFTTQVIGNTDSCNHNFCLRCLQEWRKAANICPVDRIMFSAVLVRRCLGGKVIRRIPVESPKKQENDDDMLICDTCGEIEYDNMLVCHDCMHFYHEECLDPTTLGEGFEARFCPNCKQPVCFM